jgi:hypothetical protein
MSLIPLFGSIESVPQMLGSLAFAGFELYADPGAGVRLRYERLMTKADVYLYNLGLENIPEDIHSEAVQMGFDHACFEISHALEIGDYLEYADISNGELCIPETLPTPNYIWCAFSYRQAAGVNTSFDGLRHSHLLLRSRAGHFVKIRYTYPVELADVEEAEAPVFVQDLESALVALRN